MKAWQLKNTKRWAANYKIPRNLKLGRRYRQGNSSSIAATDPGRHWVRMPCELPKTTSSVICTEWPDSVVD